MGPDDAPSKAGPAEPKAPQSLPSIGVPKGGGAIRGMGEKFSANPGTGSLTVPLYSSPGRSGFGPDLSLTYDSGSGNGRRRSDPSTPAARRSMPPPKAAAT